MTGVDRFTPHYAREIKEANLAAALDHSEFRLVEADLTEGNLRELLTGIDYIFHLAAQPGVRGSWGEAFDTYLRNNVLATQRLLEAAKGSSIEVFVHASSSSVYGEASRLPTPETAGPRPVSPYGATKLAAEYLCHLYWRNFQVPVVILRYFTVYGPRQRPDMAFHRFIEASIRGEEIRIFGDGEQTRDFTFVEDAVEANLLAIRHSKPGEIYNIGGGSRVSVNRVLELIGDLLGQRPAATLEEPRPGDARHTAADIRKAGEEMHYRPRVLLEEGLRRQIEWHRAAERPRD